MSISKVIWTFEIFEFKNMIIENEYLSLQIINEDHVNSQYQMKEIMTDVLLPTAHRQAARGNTMSVFMTMYVLVRSLEA